MSFIGTTSANRWLTNLKANLDKKQDALTTTQLAAANSGITAALVTKLNGVAEGANKYTLPVAAANTLGGVKIGSNITVASDGTISVPDSTAPANNATITVTAFDGTTTTFGTNDATAKTVGKAMSDAQKNAINSGITGSKVTSYDGLVTKYSSYAVSNASDVTANTTSDVKLPTTAAVQYLITQKKYQTASDVSDAIASAQVGAAMFQGTVSKASDIANGYKKGYYWVVSTAGTYVGQTCEAGDMIFAVKDATSSTALTNSDFTVVQNNIVEMTESEVDAAFTAAGLSVAS